jgi:site-specific DNA-methyltransferase (adenine-specific)
MRDSVPITNRGTSTRGQLALESAPLKTTPLGRCLSNEIKNGDCLDVLPTFPSQSVDFVLTDPPYLVHYRDRDGRTVANDDKASWLIPAFSEIYRVLKSHRFCVSFYGWSKVDQFFAAWRQAGFRPVAHLVWTKQYASRQRFVGYHHEQAYLLAKGSPVEPAIALGDVLRWKYTENRLHPTEKPVSGLVPLVQVFSRPGEVVLDPFCGSGSTLVAAHQLGRRYLGIELDAKYCAVAKQRLRSKGFMVDLDLWTESNIIGPLELVALDTNASNRKDRQRAVDEVKSAIRTKVLESFRNGRKRIGA